MDALIGALNNPLVLLVIQLIFGVLVKRWSALAAWPNKLIPLFNFILAVLVKLGGPGVANAGVFSVIGANLGQILIQSAVQTLLATGVHSTSKNLWQNVIKVAAKKVATVV